MNGFKKTHLKLPKPDAIAEYVLIVEDNMNLCLQLADKRITIAFNAAELQEMCRSHFHTCIANENPLPNNAKADIYLYHTDSLSHFSENLVEGEFLHEKSINRSDWSGNIADYDIYYQTPDLLSYYSRDKVRAYVLYGRILVDNILTSNSNPAHKMIISPVVSHFPTICDHLYLLLAEFSDTICLHGALVELDGKVLLLTGQSGSGKSTTALSLLREGATLFSDEIVLLSEKDDSILAEGLPIAPCLVGDSPYNLASLETSLGANSNTKSRVELAGFHNNISHCMKRKIDSILFFNTPESERISDHTLSPVDDMDLFHHLKDQLLGYNFPKQQGRRLQFLLHLISETKTFIFTPGSSLKTLASFLKENI